MVVFELISREVRLEKRSLLTLACISGLTNALVLAVINLAAAHVSDTTKDNQTLYFFALFILIIVIYVLSQRRLMLRATEHVEQAINRLRSHLVERIRHCELATIEGIGKERIYTTISKELQTISQASQLFVIAGQAAILVFFTALYILWLSPTAFIVTAGFMVAGATIHRLRNKEIRYQLNLAFQRENDLVARLSDLLDGFKEVKLSRSRAEELQAEISQDSEIVTAARTRTQNLYSTDFVLSQTTFFLATGAMVFVVPILSQVYPDVVIKVTTASLFLIGPISNIVGGIPIYTNANAAAENVMALEEELREAQWETATAEPLTSFNEITLKNLYFQHTAVEGDRAFAVGPIDLTIHQGQVIFITGGNGSGKTTFIRLLTGLYHAQRGSIEVDGRRITDYDLDAYRNLFTAVFSDFHLFERLYGTTGYDPDEADEWLQFLEMDHKVHLSDGAFSTVDLSGGQRKRLALMSSVLENRPIFIFDEWAADQDPHFRRKFYEEVLPRLKARKQTVIAITHDDKYFDLADVQLNMYDGRLEDGSPTPEY